MEIFWDAVPCTPVNIIDVSEVISTSIIRAMNAS
jgi:hypothetical protein